MARIEWAMWANENAVIACGSEYNHNIIMPFLDSLLEKGFSLLT